MQQFVNSLNFFEQSLIRVEKNGLGFQSQDLSVIQKLNNFQSSFLIDLEGSVLDSLLGSLDDSEYLAPVIETVLKKLVSLFTQLCFRYF